MKLSSLNRGLVAHCPLDKESETVGSDLFSGWDFTSGWVASLTITDSDTLTCTGDAQTAYTAPMLTSGKKYRMRIAGIAAGTITQFRVEASGGTISSSLTGTFDDTFEFTGDGDLRITLRAYGSGTIDVSKMEIKELHTNDKTPNENTGILYGTSFTTDRMGQANRAMSFDGGSDYIDCGTDNSLNMADGITISAWVKPETASGYSAGFRTIVSKGEHTSDAYGFYWNTATNQLTFTINNIARSDQSYSYTSRVGLWTHLVATYDKQNLKIFANDVQVGSDEAYTSAIGTDADDLLIGWAGSDRYLPGSFADVRIYNRALNTTEIKQLYNQYNSVVII